MKFVESSLFFFNGNDPIYMDRTDKEVECRQ